MKELQGPGRHLTADMLYERVRKKLPNISLGTVYRNLEMLSRAGLIRKLQMGGGRKQFDSGLHHHYHVRCVVCGRVSDVSPEAFPALDTLASGASDFKIMGHQLKFDGLCPACKAKSAAAGSA